MAGESADGGCSEGSEEGQYNGVSWVDKSDACEALVAGGLRLRFRRGRDDTPDAATWHPEAET